jgi:hypothetical protein
MATERLDSTQALGEGEDTESPDKGVDIVSCALERERDHTAEAAHLALGKRVVGVALEAGIVDVAHAGMALEELGDALRVLAVLAHADRQRFDTTYGQPGIEWARNTTRGVLIELEVAI